MFAMFEIKLAKGLVKDLEEIARQQGFKPQIHTFYETGRTAACGFCSSNKDGGFHYGFPFLFCAKRLYQDIHPELLKKYVRSLVLHEKVHHESMFETKEDGDEKEIAVDREASFRYGNIIEYMALDLLIPEGMSVRLNKKFTTRELASKIKEKAEKYYWVDKKTREKIILLMSDKKFYTKRNLLKYFEIKAR
jgi:hypothetical protein